MNDGTVKSWALGLAVFAFGLLTIGSVLFGARVTTALLRGVGGGLVFGTLLWLVGSMLVNEEFPMEESSLLDEEVFENEGLEEADENEPS